MALGDCFKKAPVPAPIGERPDHDKGGQKLLWCPFAERYKKDMATHGQYRNKYPEGAIVHFTAGSTIESSIDYGLSQGFGFWGIGREGRLYQTHPLDRYTSHAGESKWPGLGTNVSQYLVGIEVAAAGRVDDMGGGRYKSWYHHTPEEYFHESEVRHIPKDNDNQLHGIYHAYTKEQESRLIQVLLWLKWNNPEVFNFDFVLGHDEVAGPKGIGYWRKNDPGGALSMTMSDFRQFLKNEYKRVYG